MGHLINKKTLSWALYDWANSAYATAVMAGFFPIFFKSYWSSGIEVTQSTFYLGMANSVSSLVIVFIAPVLGALADAGGIRKRFLMFFTLLGSGMTAGLFLLGEGQAVQAISLYILATIGFLGSMVFYDSLLIAVSKEEDFDTVSAFGYALGYLGGGILFACTVAMALGWEGFGFSDAGRAVKLAFLFVAIWWLVFALPLMLNVPEKRQNISRGTLDIVRSAFRQLRDTFLHIRQLRVVFLFLLAYWLYIDGVDTIVVMAVDYGVALGFESDSLIVALLITQFVGFPAAIGFGFLGARIGPRRAILIAISVYIGITLWAFRMDTVSEFYTLAIVVGLVQGGVQSLSRSLYARLIPPDKSAEFFGFYNMVGKFAAILGPTLVGVVAVVSGSSRYGILSVSLLFISGGLLLYFLDFDKASSRQE